MKTTIDRAGRLVLPKAIRREARIEPGAQLEVRVRDGRIEIEPAPLEVKLRKRGILTVAVPSRPMPPLTQEEVATTIASLRRRGAAGD
ncbi:MAG TPA: AbrB/MazE/SpoVT family DNA-binding domain-containing protein [Vicinamibacteria bacterium]|nr:AbrB/MazE/SpoVT family DNA-binding domain-containing protein [Vicinamibacteria bacterium]